MRNLSIITILIFLSLSNASYARKFRFPDVEREKKLSAHYNIHPGDKLVIDNTYGLVHMNTWDKDEVTVDITIKVRAINEAKADEIMDRVSFKQESNEQGSHRIYYKTIIGPVKTRNNNTRMEVNYVINMPRKLAIDITNKYGDIYLDDFMGPLQMDLSYGAISAKSITGSDKNIHVAYGRGTIVSLEGGHVDLQYSDFAVDKGQSLTIKNVFGKLNIGSVQSLNIDQKYGDLAIGSVGSLAGNIDYAGLDVTTLSKSADLKIKYCGRVDFRNITNNVTLVKIDASYSTMNLHLDRNTNLAMDIVTSYGELSAPLAKQLGLYEERRVGTITYYSGKTGNGSGKLQLSAKYGNITLK